MKYRLEEPQPTTKNHILIIGGGIAGLAAALALHKKGYKISVFEKFEQHFIEGNGAGLSMVRKVLDILHEIGVDKQLIRQKTNLANNMVLETYEGKRIMVEKGTSKLSASWSNLYEMLDQSLPKDVIHYAKRIVAIEKIKSGEIQLTDQNGCRFKGDLLIVADGARSPVREKLTRKNTMDVITYTGHLNLRGLIDITNSPQDEAFYQKLKAYYPNIEDEIYIEFGDEHHTGMQMLPNRRISWWSYVNSKDPLIWPNLTAVGQFLTDDMVKNLYAKMKGQVSERLQHVFNHTTNHMMNVITDATIDKWVYHDNIVLIGDAAHPMTPNCGLAACMAVVDGYTLAKYISTYRQNYQQAIKAYEKDRLPVVQKFVKLCHECGQERNALKNHQGPLETFDSHYQKAHALFVSQKNITTPKIPSKL